MGPCFSECGPGAGSISISWDLVRDAESSPPQASWTSISPVTRSQGICVHIQVWETLVWSIGRCPHSPGSAVPWALPSRGARRQWWKERVWLLQTHRGGRRCSQRGPSFRNVGTPAGMATCLLPPSCPGAQGACRDRKLSPPSKQSSELRPVGQSLCFPRAGLPYASSRSPVSEGQAGKTEAAGPGQLVMRLIHRTATAEGVLKTLDPTLITCQPARPNRAQKLWNKRAISYYF